MLTPSPDRLCLQVVLTTIERRKMQHANDVSQLQASIESMTQTRFPAVFLTLASFAKLGKMVRARRASNAIQSMPALTTRGTPPAPHGTPTTPCG